MSSPPCFQKKKFGSSALFVRAPSPKRMIGSLVRSKQGLALNLRE